MKKKHGDFAKALIVNPKRYADAGGAQEARLFTYYAGYSSVFASTLLASLNLPSNACILDPWNGSGVTTRTARRFGYKTIGKDLNPVMVLIANAELLSPHDVGSLLPRAHDIMFRVRQQNRRSSETDPLCKWLVPSTASFIRAIEREIIESLVPRRNQRRLLLQGDFDNISSVAAFFYVALFGVTHTLLKKFRATNPMWIKSPAKPHLRISLGRWRLKSLFLDEVKSLSALLAVHSFYLSNRSQTCSISAGNSERLALRGRSVDMVLTSPPYCTRIDYAKATAVELAVLRYDDGKFDKLRRSLMGTSTVPSAEQAKDPSWGPTCNRFLSRIYRHTSKASKTYYFKNHLQYFSSLHASIREISRVLKPKGKCVIVVQDSYYKDIRNDVPKIVTEMAKARGLVLQRQEDFISGRSMVGMNKRAKEYVIGRKTKESVLCFTRR